MDQGQRFANKMSQLEQCTVAEGLACSQLQPLETLVFRKKKKRNSQIPEEGGAREEEQSAQGLAGFGGVGLKSRRKL